MDPIRRKGTELIREALSSSDTDPEDVTTLAGQIEDEIYKSHNGQTNSDYKESLRSHIFNLKDSKNPLRKRILSGLITPTTFAHMSADDMASPELRLETEQLRRRSIVDSMGFDDIEPRHREQDNPDEEKQLDFSGYCIQPIRDTRVYEIFMHLSRALFQMAHQIRIAQQIVPVVGADSAIRDKVLAFEPFKEWVQRLDKAQQERDNEMDVRSVEIQSADVFSSGKLGFIKFKADVRFKETGMSAPGITFMRGGSVGVLTILKCRDDTKKDDQVLLTVQPRIAVASLAFPEIPAGMLDGSGNFTGSAAREIFEETGLKIEEDELVDMTEKAYGDRWQGVYPSAGGCDEFLRLFLCIKKMKSQDIQALEGKLTGLRDTGENITLKLVPLKDVWKAAPDVKLLSSLALYHALQLDK